MSNVWFQEIEAWLESPPEEPITPAIMAPRVMPDSVETRAGFGANRGHR